MARNPLAEDSKRRDPSTQRLATNRNEPGGNATFAKKRKQPPLRGLHAAEPRRGPAILATGRDDLGSKRGLDDNPAEPTSLRE